ncbi:MAG: leucine-rich repeat domain-containing protein [Gammaproteobacteria bacterium]|nr:leucine-rich repeat domain-containing protein [Gammaproteobacteria bacterium]MDE0413340.1 leucine-rich repeat domain-containing protein [Gammaproteobacteria bacterium]
MGLTQRGVGFGQAAEDVLRSRAVQIDARQLARARQGKAPLKLNLFGDTMLEVRVQRSRRTPQGYFVQGEVKGEELSSVSLMVNGILLTGEIHTSEGHYMIRPDRFGRHVVSQLDPMAGNEAHHYHHHEQRDAIASSPQASRALPITDNSGRLARVDVLFLYTNSAENHYGGRSGMEMEARRWIAETNQALEDGGLANRLQLVAIEKVQYNEMGGSSELSSHTLAFRKTVDVAPLQNKYVADGILVAFGRAFSDAPGILNEHAFVDTRGGAPTAAHELGHLLGLGHDRYQLSKIRDLNTSDYNFGYVSLAGRFRTIMSYPDECRDHKLLCRSIMRYSNPDQYWQGHRMGVPRTDTRTGVNGPADNITAIKDRWNEIAGKRAVCSASDYTISSRSLKSSSAGGKYFLNVDAPDNCVWEARSDATFVRIDSSRYNNGPGRVVFTVIPTKNIGSQGNLTIANQQVSVRINNSSAGICQRSSEVQAAIASALKMVQADCGKVTREQLAKVKVLDLSGLDMQSLSLGDFLHLTGLTRLLLYDNQIASVPSHLLGRKPSLTELDLSNNRLTSVPSGLLEGTPSLTELDLSNNRLTSVPSGLLGRKPSLTELDLRNNRLTSIPSGLLEGTPSLTELDLSNNRLTSIPSGLLQRTPSLTILFLAENSLRELPKGLFLGLTNLDLLTLASNIGAPFDLRISLEWAGGGRAKLVMPSGAPSDIKYQVKFENIVTGNGNVQHGQMGTIPAGAAEIEIEDVHAKPGAGAAKISIESLSSQKLKEQLIPGTPVTKHIGYSLSKGPGITIPTGSVSVTPGAIEVWEKDNPGTPEDERRAQYQLVLGSQPNNDVSILATYDTKAVVAIPGLVIFTPQNWDSPQSVTVAGADDGNADPGGSRVIEIRNVVGSHSDQGYRGLAVDPVAVTLREPDDPGVTISQRLLDIRERDDPDTAGEEHKAEYQIALDAWPTRDLVIALSSGDGNAVSVSPSKLTFTPQDWESP